MRCEDDWEWEVGKNAEGGTHGLISCYFPDIYVQNVTEYLK